MIPEAAHPAPALTRAGLRGVAAACLVAVLAGPTGCGTGPAPDDGGRATAPAAGPGDARTGQDSYVRTVLAERAAREERLRSPEGWLSVVGLHWLRPGDNRFGSAPGLEVPLPAGPPLAGVLRLEEDRVSLAPEPGAGLMQGGRPAIPGPLRADVEEGGPDVLTLGRLTLYLIRRGGQTGVRVKDPESPALKEFAGLVAYPVDPAWRLEGAWEPYDAPVVRQVPSAAGPPQEMTAAGLVRFQAGGREMILEPVVEGEELFFIFGDATNGEETYGAGRFLSAGPPEDGAVVLDFNRAYNPPCVFTPYATCPLPRPENILPVPVTAGEKVRAQH